jgi:peptidyl-prolyl cis-trans isomerase C
MGLQMTVACGIACRTGITCTQRALPCACRAIRDLQRHPMQSPLSLRRVIAATSVLMLISFAAVAQEKDATKVVAKVNGQAITEADMRLAESELGNELGTLAPDVKRRALTEYLIDNVLFAEAAEAANVAASPAFEEQMRYLRRRVLREQYFDKTLRGTVTEDEAREVYNARVASMKPEDEFAARHILVDSEDKAKKLRKKIVDGADFAEVAKENSTDPGSKDKGGFLGYFGKGQLVPEFEQAVMKLQEGELSEPVKTTFGWHIIKLEDRRRKELPPFDQVKDTITNSLIVRKAQERAAALREKAKLEYIDAGIKKQVEEQKKKEEEAAAAAKAATPAAEPAKPADAAAPAAEPAAPKKE